MSKYPHGKMRPDDLGAWTLAISVDAAKRVVFVHFGKPMDWLGFRKSEALEFANGLRDKALQLPDDEDPTPERTGGQA